MNFSKNLDFLLAEINKIFFSPEIDKTIFFFLSFTLPCTLNKIFSGSNEIFAIEQV